MSWLTATVKRPCWWRSTVLHVWRAGFHYVTYSPEGWAPLAKRPGQRASCICGWTHLETMDPTHARTLAKAHLCEATNREVKAMTRPALTAGGAA